jgi:Arc/MetJ-type ribon-helix-helix transcriptional regulator
MNERAKVTLSEASSQLAEKLARDNGFSSASEYVDALIENDRQENVIHDWMTQRLKEGLASPNAGEMTAGKLNRIVDEALKRSPSKA